MLNDLVGKQFNRLVVISRTNEKATDGSFKWLCRCTCDKHKEVLVTSSNLKLGRVESCGCLRRESQSINIVGQRFGRLVAIERTNKSSGSNIIWKCVCDCGNIKEVDTGKLRAGVTRSCGCLAIELTKKRSKKNDYSSSFNSLYSLYKSKSSKRNLSLK
ncbi:MAG: hypothetical protein HC874_32320 [Richelia sp. SL_2_1]|nr:hypothetical protein [Richelia sp. SL_2_1]